MVILDVNNFNLTCAKVFNEKFYGMTFYTISNHLMPWILAHINLNLVCLLIMTTYLLYFSVKLWILLLFNYFSFKEYENQYETINL